MGQRILTVMAAVAVLACCALIGWMCQTLMQMQNAQRDMLRESRAQNAKLLEQFQSALAGLKSAPADAAPAEWNRLTVKCTFDTEDGPPAAGVEVGFRGESEGTRNIPGDQQKSDAVGMIDFGKVVYGHYEIWCRTLDGKYSQFTVAVRPGRNKDVNVVCPSAEPSTQPIHFDFEPPDSLTSKDIYYIAVIERANQSLGALSWSPAWDKFERPCYVLDRRGQVLGRVEADAARILTKRVSGGNLAIKEPEFTRALKNLKLTPVADLPGYSLAGDIAAFIVDDKNPAEPVSAVPPLKTVGYLVSPIYLDESRTLKLSGDPSVFWRNVEGEIR